MKKATLVLICDNTYVMQTSVAITSAIQNKAMDSEYNIYVLGDGLSEESVSTLLSLKKTDVNLTVIPAALNAGLSALEESDSIYRVATKAALLKFEIPQILKEPKVLYLDGDILVLDDLVPLFEAELGEHYAAVVRDLPQVLFDTPLIDTGSGRDYFNSGVMVLNLERLRQDDIPRKLVETKRAMVKDSLMDQNVLNIVFGGNVIQLPPRYNVLYANLRRSWKQPGVVQRLNALYATNYQRPSDCLKDAVVIHYSSKDKPWRYFDAPLSRLWMRYYRNSPYGTVPLKRKSLLWYRVQRKLERLFFRR